MPVLPSYRNQSIDLHSKSIDWFLYEAIVEINGLIEEERKWIKGKTQKFLSELIYLKVFLEKKCQK